MKADNGMILTCDHRSFTGYCSEGQGRLRNDLGAARIPARSLRDWSAEQFKTDWRCAHKREVQVVTATAVANSEVRACGETNGIHDHNVVLAHKMRRSAAGINVPPRGLKTAGSMLYECSGFLCRPHDLNSFPTITANTDCQTVS